MLSTPPTSYLEAGDDDLEDALHESNYMTPVGRESGVRRNPHGGLCVGAVRNEGALREVWASLITGSGDRIVCDAPHRAHVILQVVLDERNNAVRGSNVAVVGLNNIHGVEFWAVGIPGATAAAKMAFVYDLLVTELQMDTDYDE